MKPKSIRLYIKPSCPWCHEAIAWLDAHKFEYEKRDVFSDPSAAREMLQLTGQTLAPSIDIDGQVLGDFDTDELERFLRDRNIDF